MFSEHLLCDSLVLGELLVLDWQGGDGQSGERFQLNKEE